MVNLVVDDKIVIKCHQPQRTVLANLDVAKSLFELVLRRSEEFRKSIELARANPIELSVEFGFRVLRRRLRNPTHKECYEYCAHSLFIHIAFPFHILT